MVEMLKDRKKRYLRDGVRISVGDLIMPYFVIEGNRRAIPFPSMPGVSRLSVDHLLKEVKEARALGIKSVLLFGVPAPKYKDHAGSYAYSEAGIVPRAVAALKKAVKGITVITDVCLCAYTNHGHCGVINKGSKAINHKATLAALSAVALSHAQAGADWVAPSAMAKKQIMAIREALDKNGYIKIRILGYSAKFVSNFYGPFREAADSAPKFGDRRAYQLDYAKGNAALKEIAVDIKEGADMVMVKPALSYLDIIREVKDEFHFPLAAYNVSGEYAFVKYGAKKGWWDEKGLVGEIIASIKRAGADKIISYHAKDIARWLKEED